MIKCLQSDKAREWPPVLLRQQWPHSDHNIIIIKGEEYNFCQITLHFLFYQFPIFGTNDVIQQKIKNSIVTSLLCQLILWWAGVRLLKSMVFALVEVGSWDKNHPFLMIKCLHGDKARKGPPVLLRQQKRCPHFDHNITIGRGRQRL